MKMRWFLFAVAFLAPVLFAQTPNYEGHAVAAVEFVTNPVLDTSDLPHLIQQKAHSPYSDKKVQASISALMRTGRFREVRLDVMPETAGLRIRFVLEPAYYYGLVDFPGAVKAFSYTRLLQVINLPDQDPYEKNKVLSAQKSLLEFYGHNGYFDARVNTETKLDWAHGLANLDFASDLGRRAKVGNVEILGPPSEEAARLLGVTRSWRARFTGASLKPGKSFTPKRIDAATKLIKNDLVKRGYLASRINLDPTQYHPDTHHADLNIRVDERKKVDINITGARLSLIPFLASRQKKKLLPFYEEGTVDQDLVQEGRRNLTDYFQGKGYFDARVQTSVQRQPNHVFLVYQITKGKKHKVANIVFRGNHNADDDDLIQQVAVKKGRFLFTRGRYSTKLVSQSVKGLKAFYENRGYEDVSVTPQTIDKEPNINIIFNIAEGTQTRVAQVKMNGLQHVSRKDIESKEKFQIDEGRPFSPQGLAKDRGLILATYLDRGYLAADVKTAITRHPEDQHLVDITYNISEGLQVQIGNVVTIGAPHTRRSLINRSANLYMEAPLSQSSLLEAESRLYNEGIFDYASVGSKRPIKDQSEEMVVLKLHEAKRNTITYGVGFEVARRGGNIPSGTVAIPGLPPVGLGKAKVASSEQLFASPRGSVEFIRRNMRGLGETASIALLGARLRQRLLATYADPHFRGSSWRSLLSISGERTSENPLFTANLANVTLQFERTITSDRNTTAQVRYSFGHTSLSRLIIPDLVLPEDRRVRLSTFSGTIIRDTRDKPLDAHTGFFQTLDLGVTAEALGASATFARLSGQNAYYRPLPFGLVWANSIRVGLEKSFVGSRIPTSERFFAGGGTTLRGFPINQAGPQRSVAVCSNPNDPTTCSTIPVPVGGNMLAILNSEIRFPIPIMSNLGGAVFYDGGNVYRHINLHEFTDQFSHTVGIGFRYSTPVGPIRFDVGRNLTPIQGIRATQFFVTLGQAF